MADGTTWIPAKKSKKNPGRGVNWSRLNESYHVLVGKDAERPKCKSHRCFECGVERDPVFFTMQDRPALGRNRVVLICDKCLK